MQNINHITENDCVDFELNKDFNIYQRIATKSAIYPGRGTMLGMSYVLHKLAGEAGEANEHFGKAQRDDELFSLSHAFTDHEVGVEPEKIIVIKMNALTPERRELIIKEIGDVLWYLSALCNELGVSLSYIAAQNLRKLWKRTVENKLQGSGDNR